MMKIITLTGDTKSFIEKMEYDVFPHCSHKFVTINCDKFDSGFIISTLINQVAYNTVGSINSIVILKNIKDTQDLKDKPDEMYDFLDKIYSYELGILILDLNGVNLLCHLTIPTNMWILTQTKIFAKSDIVVNVNYKNSFSCHITKHISKKVDYLRTKSKMIQELDTQYFKSSNITSNMYSPATKIQLPNGSICPICKCITGLKGIDGCYCN